MIATAQQHLSTRLRRDRPAKRRRRWPVLVGLLALVAAVVAITMSPGNEPADVQWFEGETYNNWTVRYTGYGEVTSNGQRITLEPQAAKNHDVTHGGLVHTAEECRHGDFAVTVHTEAQVRQGEPNTWEVGWVLWNFQSDTHFYAVALKPNGWEISKQDPDYPGNQRFLASGDTPTFPIGHDYRVSVTQHAEGMKVSADGTELATISDSETPYHEGSIGLYTEDARVHFSDFDLPECVR